MKPITLFTVLMLFVATVNAKHIYTLTKADVIAQFSNRTTDRIYCYNENGEKVWLRYIKKPETVLIANGDEGKPFVLNTVKYYNDTLAGVAYTSFQLKRKIQYLNTRGIDTFTIETKGGPYLYPVEKEAPFVNFDSCRKIAKAKNDSIVNAYATGTELILQLVAKDRATNDTLPILTGACYNIKFKDGNHVMWGVVKKLNQDSIYITSSFDAAVAAKEKKAYKVYQYAIGDIAGFELLKRDHYTARKVDVADYDMMFEHVDRALLKHLWSYSIDHYYGTLMFDIPYLEDRHFSAIADQDGHPVFAIGDQEWTPR